MARACGAERRGAKSRRRLRSGSTGAVRERGPLRSARWQPCGAVLAEATAELFRQLPEPTAVRISGVHVGGSAAQRLNRQREANRNSKRKALTTALKFAAKFHYQCPHFIANAHQFQPTRSSACFVGVRNARPLVEVLDIMIFVILSLALRPSHGDAQPEACVRMCSCSDAEIKNAIVMAWPLE